MGVVARSAEQYAEMIQKLFPRGRAWVRSSFSAFFSMLLGMAVEFARIDSAMVGVFDEVFPTTSTDLISRWEKMVGLPDSVQSISPFMDVRRTDVTRKLTDPGGQSDSTFENIAAFFGYTGVTLSLYRPFRTGITVVGTPLYSQAWRNHMRVHVPAIIARPFRMGDTVNQPMRTWRNGTLEAAIRKATQSHIGVIFTYGS